MNSEYVFFQPTITFKEFKILEMIKNKHKITQREISDIIGSAVSSVNEYIDEFEKKKLIVRKHLNPKNIKYIITKKGLDRMKYLNLLFIKASQELFTSSKKNILQFLKQIPLNGFKKIYLYGAGEVADIILDILISEKQIDLTLMGLIDDDEKKISSFIRKFKIISFDHIKKVNYDGILISSYTHHKKIQNKLLRSGINKSKIINFFNQ